jgi:metacaspase-1
MIFYLIVYMSKRALLIGINYLNTEHQLDGCIDDIINARNMLIDAYDYEKNNIVMLRDDVDDPNYLPTFENIMKSLDNIVSNSHECSEIWIQYSGHGAQFGRTDSDVLVPCDLQYQRYIFDHDVHRFITKINQKCIAIFVMDCCHSGSLGKLPWTITVNEKSEFVTTENKDIHSIESMPNPNIYFLTACKESQTSSDVYSRELAEGVGAFSNAFNECLRDSRHHIDILTLYKNISECMTKSGYSQTPVLSSTNSKPTYVFQKPPFK